MQIIQDNQDNQLRLAHLWVDFRDIYTPPPPLSSCMAKYIFAIYLAAHEEGREAEGGGN